MTLAELERLLASKRRTQEIEDKKKAYFDYTLADLIGHSMARLYKTGKKYPSIEEVYPALFEEDSREEDLIKRQDELSALRFKQFANAHNKKFEGGK